MFNKDGMNSIAKLLHHISTCATVERDVVGIVAPGLVRYMGKIEKAQ